MIISTSSAFLVQTTRDIQSPTERPPHSMNQRALPPCRLLAYLLAAVAIGNLQIVHAAQTCALKISLLDESGAPVPGLIRVSVDNDKAVPLPNLINRGAMLRRGSPAKEWHCLVEPAVISLPQARVTVNAISGIETRLTSKTIDLAGKQQANLTLKLKRFSNLREDGWRAGNTHVHTRNMTRAESNRYLQAVGLSDDLELIFVSHLRRAQAEKTYISNEYTKRDLRALSLPGLTFENGEEHRHNFGGGGEGFGHVMLLDLNELVRPVSVGPGIMKTGTDAPPLARGIVTARKDGATVVWCHNNFGYEDIPNWLSGRVDAQNIFDGGNRGGYEDTFYRYLNLGIRVPFSTGTDWFIYDFSRVYAHIGDKKLTAHNWLTSLNQGRTFISNGPLLDLRIGGAKIGAVINLRTQDELPIHAQAKGRINFGHIELIRNGEVIGSADSMKDDGFFTASIEINSKADRTSWFALRVANPIQQTGANAPARGTGAGKNELGEPLFAHTSPIYVRVDDEPQFDLETARQLVKDMEAGLLAIQMRAVFADDRERAAVEGVYKDAISELNRNIAADTGSR